MPSMRALLNPKAIAVVGASQQPGRGTSVVANLRGAGFGGGIFAVNPRYTDVLGFTCYPSVSELPAAVDCLVLAIPAPAACCGREQAMGRGGGAAAVSPVRPPGPPPVVRPVYGHPPPAGNRALGDRFRG